jgi:hypothetical protein
VPIYQQGRLPLNDKGINDALENGITSCLRSLQRTNPNLLLTAHQLKRVERDSKYVPAVAGAIASVLCRSRHVGLYEHAMNVMSGWDAEVQSLGIPPFDQVIEPSQRNRTNSYQSINPHASAQQREMCRVALLRPILERRLRFVVSEEFKDAKKQVREDKAATRKKERANQQKNPNRVAQGDDTNSDCFVESDESIKHRTTSWLPEPVHSDFDSDISSPERCDSARRPNNMKLDESEVSDEASQENKRRLSRNPCIIHSPANYDGFDSDDDEDEKVTPAKPRDLCKQDCMSDDDWSEEYGMVVPGSFFR